MMVSVGIAVVTVWVAIALAYLTDWPVGFFVGASVRWPTPQDGWRHDVLAGDDCGDCAHRGGSAGRAARADRAGDGRCVFSGLAVSTAEDLGHSAAGRRACERGGGRGSRRMARDQGGADHLESGATGREKRLLIVGGATEFAEAFASVMR